MAGLAYSSEKFFGFPLRDGSVTFGSVSAQNVQPLLQLANSVLLPANLSYLTVTISLPGLPVGQIPFERPSVQNYGSQTFVYQNEQYVVIDVQKSGTYSIGAQPVYFNYILKGVRLDPPLITTG